MFSLKAQFHNKIKKALLLQEKQCRLVKQPLGSRLGLSFAHLLIEYYCKS